MELWEHQAKYGKAIREDGLRALWWEPRCGKLLTSLEGTKDGSRLIVCPNSVKADWLTMLGKFAPSESSFAWGFGSKPVDRPRNCIVNYESLVRSYVLGMEWDSIIFDESQRIQGWNTKMWAHIAQNMATLRKAKRVVLLSGTPCPEGSHQLVTQTLAVAGKVGQYTEAWDAVRNLYCYDEYRYKWLPLPGTDEMMKGLMHTYGHSMTQKEAGVDTAKLHKVVEIPYGKHEADIWDSSETDDPKLKTMYAQSAASGRDIGTGEVEQSTKLDAVAEYAMELGRPSIILTHFVASAEYLHKRLGKEWALLHGKDDGAKYRYEAIRSMSIGQTKGLIATVPVVKVGLNLSAADTLIFAENEWSGEARIQAEERCTVRGKGAVEIVDFVSVGQGPLGQVDTKIMEAVRGKKDFNQRMMGL
jgi:hypothetical protein